MTGATDISAPIPPRNSSLAAAGAVGATRFGPWRAAASRVAEPDDRVLECAWDDEIGLSKPSMQLIVDGQERTVADGLTVLALIESEGLSGAQVLVEVNGQYLPPSAYGERVLRAGDRVEMILPAFGG